MIKSNQCHLCPEKYKNYHLLYKPISSLKFQVRENRLLLSPSITDYLRQTTLLNYPLFQFLIYQVIYNQISTDIPKIFPILIRNVCNFNKICFHNLLGHRLKFLRILWQFSVIRSSALLCAQSKKEIVSHLMARRREKMLSDEILEK